MKEPLPPDLDPMVSTHLASAAYRVLNGCVGFTFGEQEAMAHAVVDLDRERRELRRQLTEAQEERKKRQSKITALRFALRDCISTYDPNRAETFVGAERQEAWAEALNS